MIIGEDHIGGVLGHLGAGDSHGDSDICLFERRSIVYTVAGHGDDPAFSLPCLHDADLMLGSHPRIDRYLFYHLIQRVVRESIQLRTGVGQIAVVPDSDLTRDRNGRLLMISRDHDRLYAGLRRIFHCSCGFRAGWIHHCDQSQEEKSLF